MSNRRGNMACLAVGLFALGLWAGRISAVGAQEGQKVFELRTYTTAEGKLETLSNRFRDRTLTLFKKHGMTTVGVWIPTDAPQSANTLIFLMVWPSRDAADKTWQEFGNDSEWKALVDETEKNGRLWTKLDRVWMSPTGYSPMK